MLNLKNKERPKKPEHQSFYKILALYIGISALSSQCWDWFDLPRNRLYQIQRLSVLIMLPLAVISQFIYFILNYSKYDIVSLSLIFIITLVTPLILIRVMKAQTKDFKKAMRAFMSHIHIYNVYKTNRDQYTEKVLKTVEKLTRWTFIVSFVLCIFCCCSFQVVTITHSIGILEEVANKSTKLEFLVHFWIPFLEYEYNVKIWIIFQFIILYCILVAMPILGLFDSLNLTFMYHIIGHVKILKHKLIVDFNKCNMSQEEIKENLTKTSNYYFFIKECIKSAESAFGLNVFIVYVHNLIGGGLFIFYITLPGNNVAEFFSYSLMIPLTTGIMLLLSLTLEYMRITADNIPDLVYGLKWESMSTPNQKLILMLLMQVQKPLEFKAAFNIKTGMQPAINIIKMAFSYFLMIRAL